MRNLFLLLPPILALTAVVAACGGGGTGTPPPPPPPAAAFGLTQRVPLQGLSFDGGLVTPVPLDKVQAFAALSFTRPVILTAAPDGSTWLFVAEQAGRVFVFENRDDITEASTFLDIESLVRRAENEEGFLGLAFDPDWDETGGDFYVYYSASSPRRTVLARHSASFSAGETPVADEGPGEVLLEITQPHANHNGGMLAFGPDGMLYLGVGDGGSSNDPGRNGQDLGTLLGTILRLDVRGKTTYEVPSDNPFVGTPGARGEIFAYGLRNPWRFAFDPNTEDIWVGDVGQVSREEVTRVRAGENHGWPVYEGKRSNVNPGALPITAFSGPILDYPRDEGTCVIGGPVYRGPGLPSLRGAYVYGDYGSGRIWALVMDGDEIHANEEIQNVPRVSTFGEDHRGELYAVSLNGSIWRFEEGDVTPPPAYPMSLSETGLFASVSVLTPNPGLIPYEPNAEGWHDGATSTRWIGLPGSSTIGFSPTLPWDFPDGTVLVQHLELELRVGDPTSARRLETRLLLKEGADWVPLTYRWLGDESDARLLSARETATFDIEDPAAPGGTREQRWDFPSRGDCLRCHTSSAGTALGVHTRQLNGPFDYAAATDNQLRSWNHIGLFDAPISTPTSYGAFADPLDEAAPLDLRARAWMDVNCASCHRPVGAAPNDIDFRAEVSEASMRIVGVRPTNGELDILDALRVAAGDPDRSVVLERVLRTDETRMPPVGSREPDEAGAALLDAWIQAR